MLNVFVYLDLQISIIFYDHLKTQSAVNFVAAQKITIPLSFVYFSLFFFFSQKFEITAYITIEVRTLI